MTMVSGAGRLFLQSRRAEVADFESGIRAKALFRSGSRILLETGPKQFNFGKMNLLPKTMLYFAVVLGARP
jgi:hypothetical protein